MGMFDYVRVEIPLEGLENAPELEFQTKSMLSLMDTYTIKKDKTLWCKSSVWMVDENVSYESAPFDPNAYTGEIRFYTDIVRVDEEDGLKYSWWHEYVALFHHGKMV